MRNVSAVDAWTFSHVAVGYVAAKLDISLKTYLGLAVVYELVEYSMETPHGSKFFGTKRPESGINMVVDVAAGAAGHWLGKI